MTIKKIFHIHTKNHNVQKVFNSLQQSRSAEPKLTPHNPLVAQAVAVSNNRFQAHEKTLATSVDIHEQGLHRSEKSLLTQVFSIGATLSQKVTDGINRLNRFAANNQKRVLAPQMA